MGAPRSLGSLERAVMDQLWDTGGPQTVRQVHQALSTQRDLAYNTVMTVLQRLSRKRLVVQIRDDRAYQYLLFAAEPYETVAFKVPALEVDKNADRLFTHW